MKKTISIILTAILFISITGCGSNHENEAQLPFGSKECGKMLYEGAVEQFENAGFSNIITNQIDDLVTGWITKDGEVEKITIDGKESFSKNEWTSKAANIIITYHTFPEKNNADITSDANDSSSQTTIDIPKRKALSELTSSYSKLSDSEFALLTETIATSFYSFSISEEEYDHLMTNPNVMNCLTQLYDYASKNYMELDPDYKEFFSYKQDVVVKINNYDILNSNFRIERYFDSNSDEWVYTIDSYVLNPDDVVQYEDKQYIDAEGYLAPGVIVYWIEEGKMEEAGTIVDVAYNLTLDGTEYAYAVNVNFIGDPYSSGWQDGQVLLQVNKKLTGKPLYYVRVLDPNRRITKEEIDYEGNINWKPLSSVSPKKEMEVYMGINSTKTLLFTVIDFDKERDLFVVKYPSGSVENKSYSAIIGNKALYVK